jgi:DNA invertase Pin-like site-specific DNA recombinase
MQNTTGSSLHIGYARVSTDDQELNLQIDALNQAGCQRIYSETVSSRFPVAKRPQLDECLRMLREGDTLTVWRLDRLGRNLTELVAIVNDLHDRGVAFESLTEHIDTSSAAGNLMFQLFASLAEFERNIIRERTHAGLIAARARGRMGGRKPKVTAKAKKEMKALYDSREITINDICKRYEISNSTFYRAVLGKIYGDSRQTHEHDERRRPSVQDFARQPGDHRKNQENPQGKAGAADRQPVDFAALDG